MGTEEWLLEVSYWKKIIQRKIVSNTQQEAQKEIMEKVEARFGMIDKEERKMINSILEKPWRRILIDKVIVQDTESKDTKILLTESDEVKKAADEYYKDQFKARKHQFDSITEEWKKEDIEEEWYRNILNSIEEEEWIENI